MRLEFWVSLRYKISWPRITAPWELHIPPGTFVQLRGITQVFAFHVCEIPPIDSPWQKWKCVLSPSIEKAGGWGLFSVADYYYYDYYY